MNNRRCSMTVPNPAHDPNVEGALKELPCPGIPKYAWCVSDKAEGVITLCPQHFNTRYEWEVAQEHQRWMAKKLDLLKKERIKKLAEAEAN